MQHGLVGLGQVTYYMIRGRVVSGRIDVVLWLPLDLLVLGSNSAIFSISPGTAFLIFCCLKYTQERDNTE